MKTNDTSGASLPAELTELINDADIDSQFREFLIHTGIERIRGLMHHDETSILTALQKADKVEDGLCDQEAQSYRAIRFLQAIENDFSEESVFYLLAVGDHWWPGHALEYLNFLVRQTDYPPRLWKRILKDFEDLHYRIFVKGIDVSRLPLQRKFEDHIREGLLRNLKAKAPKNSALSIYFWLDPELWKDTDEDDKPYSESDSYKTNKQIFSSILTDWAKACLEDNNEDAVYALLDWLSAVSRESCINKDALDAIEGYIQKRPCILPQYPLAPKDLPAFIRAYHRETWIRPDGTKVQAAEMDQRHLSSQLVSVAELCAEDNLKFKLPQRTIRDLIPVFLWVPKDYIRNRNIPEPKQLLLATKYLALMRSLINDEHPSFDIYNYQYTLRLLVGDKSENLALRQLLITLRKCSNPCSDETLNFRPISAPKRYTLPANFNGLTPENCVCCLIDMLIDSWQVRDRFRELCLDQADFYMSRLKFKKQKGRGRSCSKQSDIYDAQKCVEQNPIWRRAYAEALGELGYALGGKVLHLLDFVRKHDPDESVRQVAHCSYRLIHREQTKDLDHWKGLRAAFWCIRKAQREALNFPINDAAAKLLRRQELRGEQQTRADRIYAHFL